jgi:phosphoribosylamine---glycine ligase
MARTFTFISKQGDGIPIAQRIEQEGHKVYFYINDERARRAGDGLITKHPEKAELISKGGKTNGTVLERVLHPSPDCVIFDMVGLGFGSAADRIRGMGTPVIGGSEWGDRIELDRPFGAKVMHTTGINYPLSNVFTDYKKAIEFVRETRKPYVYKPSGNQPTTTTYVAQGWEDLIGILEFYSKDIKEEFELQEKKVGVEISTEAWFNGKEVIGVNHTMEEKALMEGGKGPKAGCMGSVVWVGDTSSKLYRESLGKLEKLLRKVDYRGPIDINAIVDSKQFWGLEWTARFGYDALFVLFEMYKGKVSDLMLGTATGTIKTMDFKSQIGIGIDVAVPPYPITDCDPGIYKDILIQGLNRHNLKHFWPYDVYRQNGRFLVSGNGGDVGTITARGDEIGNFSPLRDAKRRAMRTIGNLIIPDMMYRSDIGNRVEGDKAKLKEWGWL